MATIRAIVAAKTGGLAVIEQIIVGFQMEQGIEKETWRWEHQREREIRRARLWLLSEIGLDASEEVREMGDDEIVELWRSR